MNDHKAMSKAQLLAELQGLRVRLERVERAKEPTEQQKLVHELEVHQVELEMQNRELRESRMELEESRRQFKELYDLAPVAYATFDRSGRILELNLECASLLGSTRDLLVGTLFVAVSRLEHRSSFVEHVRECLETSRTVSTELTLRVHEKPAVVVAVSSPVLVLGVPHGCRTTFTDVTARKNAQEALRASEVRFRQLADAMPQIVWTARADGSVEYMNRRGLEVPGGALADGPDWRRLVHPDDAAKIRDAWRNAITEPRIFEAECRLESERQKHRWHLVRAIPMRDAESDVIRWFGTCTDVDDQKRIEAALVEADQRKNEFLAMLAHELRNPLGAIRNAEALLRLRADGRPELSRSIDVIDRQTAHLTRLVDDLLEGARVTQGKIQLRKESFDAAQAVNRAVETARSAIEKKGHSLQVSLPREPILIHADATRVTQAIDNLLHNACKYTDHGGRISVVLAREGDEAVFTVRDSGVGIRSDMLGTIFDLFKQADRSLDRSQGGLGLGLAIVRRICDMHGGTVKALSAGPGKGSELVMRLPALPTDLSRESSPGEVHPSTRASRHRVLVVDDNEDCLDSLADYLTDTGQDVAVANNGARALEVSPSFRPTVVLLDLGLPDMDGYEVARRLRGERWSGTLIALTGYGQAEDRRRAQEAGFDHHLVKPVAFDVLEDILTRVPPISVAQPLTPEQRSSGAEREVHGA